MEKEKSTLESFIRFYFWNSSLLLQKKEFLLRFLYAFGFCNQAKSLEPTLKILLVFLCEAGANQLQQSKGCCGVSHVLGSVHHWLVTYWDSCIERKDCRYIRFSFWNPSLLLQKKEFLLRFLYAFGFCNQAKSFTPSLKILLVFLCEAVANQLHQSKGCYGVSHVLRSVHH